MVPVTGLEPVRMLLRGILSPLCLPIPPHRQTVPTLRFTPHHQQMVKESPLSSDRGLVTRTRIELVLPP